MKLCASCGLPWHMDRCELARARAVINTPQINESVINESPITVRTAPTATAARPIKRNREAYNAYMRDYMKKYRARSAA